MQFDIVTVLYSKCISPYITTLALVCNAIFANLWSLSDIFTDLYLHEIRIKRNKILTLLHYSIRNIFLCQILSANRNETNNARVVRLTYFILFFLARGRFGHTAVIKSPKPPFNIPFVLNWYLNGIHPIAFDSNCVLIVCEFFER